MITDNYQRKIGDLLDPATYHWLGRDPTALVLKRSSALFKQCSVVPDVKAAIQCSEGLPSLLCAKSS